MTLINAQTMEEAWEILAGIVLPKLAPPADATPEEKAIKEAGNKKILSLMQTVFYTGGFVNCREMAYALDVLGQPQASKVLTAHMLELATKILLRPST